MTHISSGKKCWIAVRSIVLAIALAMLSGYLIELGTASFPRYAQYVDNVVAVFIIIPMIYFVFVPFFAAFSNELPSSKSDNVDGQ